MAECASCVTIEDTGRMSRISMIFKTFDIIFKNFKHWNFWQLWSVSISILKNLGDVISSKIHDKNEKQTSFKSMKIHSLSHEMVTKKKHFYSGTIWHFKSCFALFSYFFFLLLRRRLDAHHRQSKRYFSLWNSSLCIIISMMKLDSHRH